jgi:hypothetical protein
MKKELTKHEAATILAEDEYSSFSYGGASALVEYLEEVERHCGPIEFDSVAIRCEFCEYESATYAALNNLTTEDFYAIIDDGDGGEYLTEKEKEEAFLEFFREDGELVAEIYGGGVVLRNF